MRILQISTADRGGGAEAVALSLHRALRARGHEAWLAVGYRRTDEEGVVEIGGAGSRRGRALRDPGVLIDAARGQEDFRFPASRRVLDLLPAAPDVVHVHNLHGGYFDLRGLPELAGRAPLVATLHDAWLLTGHCAHPIDSDGWLRGCGDCPHLDTYPALRRDGTAFNLARKREIYAALELTVVAPSRWLMDMVERSILAPAAVRRKVIPNGVDLDLFRPGSGERSGLVFAAQGGRANEFKDFPTLEAALERLDRQVELVALGDPPVLPEAVARRLQAAALYVHPARADTFPSGVLEALACGTPVVASRVGGIPEQVTGETGVLVEPGDPAALAGAIESLLADPARRERMSTAAAADARARFSLDRQVDAYVALYEEVAAAGACSPGPRRGRSSPRVGGGKGWTLPRQDACNCDDFVPICRQRAGYPAGVLTVFSVPKPFVGRIGEIQRRALASWVALGSGVQVLVLGDEDGAAGAAREVGAQHLPDLARTEHGTPRLDAAFAAADDVARHPLRCFVNADIVLYDDLLVATTRVAHEADRFLIVGQSIDVDEPLGRDEDRAYGKRRGAAALDWFVFPAALYPDVPPFAIGRACFDNWLVWQARQDGIVVDATADVVAAHQRHDYGHVAGGKSEAYYGSEAARNLELAGGKSHLYTLHDASHVLRGGKLHRNLGAPLRWRENVRKAAWKLGVR